MIFDASIDLLYGLFLPASFSVNLRWVDLSFPTFNEISLSPPLSDDSSAVLSHVTSLP